ncbi:MAG: flavodoxin family protein [Odoribacter sp.]|nr:flavodoxin family protein [Odoribacter sp.]
MKVVLINGSPRKNGNTFTALAEVAKTLEEEGVSTSLIQLGTQPLQGCIQCNACKESSVCVFNDSVYSEIREQLTEADGIIIGSPVYFAGPNGALCAVLDRLFYTSGELLRYKVGSAIAVCRRGGATAALDRLNKYLTYSNMMLIGSQYWNIAHGAAAGEVVEDKEGMQIMQTLGKNMAWTMKNLKAGQQPYPERESPIRTNFIRK